MSAAPGAQDRMLLAVAASLLEQGRVLDGLSRLVTAVAVIAAPFAGMALAWSGVLILVAIAALGLVQTWLALRVGFDAALFRSLSTGPADAALFDAAMTDLRLLPPEKTGRPWALRIAGARRLLAVQAVVLLAQVLLPLAAGLVLADLSR